MQLLKKPFARDTTTNSAGEVLQRLAIVFHPGGLLGGPALIAVGGWRHSTSLSVTGAALLLIGLGLHFTRRRWRANHQGPQSDAATSTPLAPPPTPTMAVRQPAPPAPSANGACPRIVLLNAGLAGAEGNSARLLARVETRLAPHAELVHAALAGPAAKDFAALTPLLRSADAFVIATGTHWDGWSSALQKFLEDATPSEATELWLGKPVAVLVSEHSAGGKGVLSRLQGVLVTLGCSIPPLSGLVISKSAQLAVHAAPAEAEDFWCCADLEIVADNLLTAARLPRATWRVWPVDRANYAKTWVEA